MKTISFDFDAKALVKPRPLKLETPQHGRFAIPNDPVYSPVRAFLQKYNTYYDKQYPFRMHKMLHTAAIQMLSGKLTKQQFDLTLFATGGLYLALDQKHDSLAIDRSFGDFTSGFSHQFGVALAIMAISEAYKIPWDRLCPIPVKGKRSLDYTIKLPGNSGWLELEAKGITGTSRAVARQNAFRKKLTDPRNLKSAKRSPHPEPTAMIGVIVQAMKKPFQNGVIEIIDPEFELEPEARQQNNQVASSYLRYASLARFAGLDLVADELTQRARVLLTGYHHDYFAQRSFYPGDGHTIEIEGHLVTGVQWKLGDSRSPQNDIWFYHGIDVERVSIVVNGEFPETIPYENDIGYNSNNHIFYPSVIEREDRVESFSPDGSYFGIGVGPRDAFLIIDRHDRDWDEGQLGRLTG